MDARMQREEASEYRNWSDLPEVLLLLIANRLFSIPDLLAFASVCATWRSVVKSDTADRTATRPPLLLHCLVPLDGNDSIELLRFRILSTDHRTYRTGLARDTLRELCIGCSYGHLIVAVSERSVVLVDAFTARVIVPPDVPEPLGGKVSHGVLTAPLSSSSCTLLLTASRDDDTVMMCWLTRSDEWRVFGFGFEPCVRSVAACDDGRVFCVDSDDGRLVRVELSPRFACEKLGSPLPRRPRPYFRNFDSYRLVDCGGELLLVLFVSAESPSWMRLSLKIAIEVYRFDFGCAEWGKVDGLGDWCLFVDPVGGSAVSCRNPTRWGGRRNAVYVAGPGGDGWSVFGLDGGVIDATAVTSRQCPLSAANWTMPRWPSPIYVPLWPTSTGYSFEYASRWYETWRWLTH